ncbi:MAG: MobC family plasmid mobilization relaxosome protein [Lachnospiraceae bacterium]|nr:MobC family plasmid mobilization relaxosome protein [Ruminococcus sp.]MCM1276511.1 MobC family plasmid mobilization relaxosome protein [Lachnospiraceae bacterium]
MRTNRKYKNLTFTFEEWQRILNYAKISKLKTATYIKQMALNGKIVVINMEKYHGAITAINRIGNNINQIARVANTSGYVTNDELRQIEKFREELCRISSAFLSGIRSQAA